ncbi:MAG: ABC transporter ATP-binding protein [Corynebacterium sp.]|nr:ABC transporter ATP-binding protein [Corynebacterium sp.]
MVLKVENVTKSYGSTQVVDGLSFAVSAGQLLCLLGANGAGKTTTIEMCEGFIAPTSGTISVLGMNPASHPDDVRAQVGIMLQGGGSYSGIRTGEMIDLAAAYSAHPHDPRWLISMLGLDAVVKTPYRRLSGGQQQRVNLALAIIARPKLIFLDEPTSGLDTQSRIAVWELVRALKRDGVAIVLTTHLMDEAEALSDEILIIDHGKQVAYGSPAQLTQSLGGPTLRLEVMQAIDTEDFERSTGLTINSLRPLHYEVENATSPTDIVAISQALARQGISLRTLDASRRNLEQVFLELTGRQLRS